MIGGDVNGGMSGRDGGRSGGRVVQPKYLQYGVMGEQQRRLDPNRDPNSAYLDGNQRSYGYGINNDQPRLPQNV